VTSFLLASPTVSYMHSVSPPHSCYMTCPSDTLIILGEEYKLWCSPLTQFSPTSHHFIPLLSSLFANTHTSDCAEERKRW
jgi:hypothetical protein